MSRFLIIQHVPHERLGTFEDFLKDAGCRLTYLNGYEANAAWPRASEFDGLITMGGPQSVYEQATYPYLTTELALLREAIKRDKPILGVCLGAQLLAAALGAKVSTNSRGKEIGWYPMMREPGADGDPLFEPFGQTETVFQWHGDTFALPKGAVQLASSPLCEQQAFRYGKQIYGLQFHLEVTEVIVRAWMQTPVNHAELSTLNGRIDPMMIRRQSPQHVARLQELSQHVIETFVRFLTPTTSRSRVHAKD